MWSFHPPDTTPFADTDIINAIKRIVNEHSANVTLESVSKEIYLNPFYISKLFKQKTGMNFTDYITEYQMKKAAHLLSDYNCKRYEISETVGYSNPKNFARTFCNSGISAAAMCVFLTADLSIYR